MDTLGKRIEKLRKEHNYTMQELADKANISKSYINDIEKGRVNPSLDTLKMIAKALNTTIGYLTGETPVKGYIYKEDFERVLGPGDYPDVMAFKKYIDRENLTWEEAKQLLELAKKIRDMNK